jgi:hypothetical protein
MSEELKKEMGEELAVQEAKVEEVKIEEPPLTGLKLYNAFKKTQPKGMGKQELALQWVAYKVSLGLPIIAKKVKKPRKVPANRLGKKDEVDDVSQMIGDFNIGPPVVDVSA